MNEHKVAYFPMWERYLELFRKTGLTHSQIGTLICAMMEYQFEGKEPEKLSKLLSSCWLFLQKDLDDAKKKYMQSVNNGKKGAKKQSQRRAAAKQAQVTEELRTDPGTTQDTLEHPEHTPGPGKSMSMSRSMSRSISGSKKESGCAASAPRERDGISLEKKPYGEFGWVVLTDKQYSKLTQDLGPEELHRCITYIDEAAQSTGNRNHWIDWNLVLRRCHKNRWHETKTNTQKDIPCGASGELGEAELEAIQQLFQREKLQNTAM